MTRSSGHCVEQRASETSRLAAAPVRDEREASPLDSFIVSQQRGRSRRQRISSHPASYPSNSLNPLNPLNSLNASRRSALPREPGGDQTLVPRLAGSLLPTRGAAYPRWGDLSATVKDSLLPAPRGEGLGMRGVRGRRVGDEEAPPNPVTARSASASLHRVPRWRPRRRCGTGSGKGATAAGLRSGH